MYKRHRYLLIPFLILVGCATVQTPKGFHQIGTRGVLGIFPQVEKDGILVHRVNANTPASRAGLQVNDLLVMFEGTDLSNEEDRSKMWEQIFSSPGREVSLKFTRNGSSRDIKVVLGSVPLYAENQVFDRISQMLIQDEKQVTVATLIGKIRNTYPIGSQETAETRKQWTESIHDNILNDYENQLISAFGQFINFRVVDRGVLEKLFEEQKFQITGAVDSQTARKLGKLTGATHLLLIDFSRLPESAILYSDTTNVRLIDVESGAVVASARISQTRQI